MPGQAPRIDTIESKTEGLNVLGTEVDLQYIDAPHTDVINRAKMVDLSNDLKPRFGVERISLQEVVFLSNETGPGETPVYKPINDIYNQVRVYGSIVTNAYNAEGSYVQISYPDGVVEITFYGTGLNLLVTDNDGIRDWRYAVDDGAVSGSSFTPSPVSTAFIGANYAANSIYPVVKGLDLGLHTVKISTPTNLIRITGYEIINESSTIIVNPGSITKNGQKVTLLTQENVPYNSTFDLEYGTDTGKGGCVSLYLKEDGTIGKSVQWTDVTRLDTTAANHYNEEVISEYHWREFGNARSDDFSTLTPATVADKAFTLSDDTTCLVADDYVASIGYGVNDGLIANTLGDDLHFTFVGTGLDILASTDASARLMEIKIDGGTVHSTSSVPSNGKSVLKIVSGLPYGTHVCTIGKASGTGICATSKFIVYGPKTPTIPSGAIELGKYNLFGDFSIASTSTNTTISHQLLSQGTLRRQNYREWVYIGSGAAWSNAGLNIVSDGLNGFRFQTGTIDASAQYTFYGTGFDFRYSQYTNNATDVRIFVDGSADLSGYTSQVYGGTSFTAGPISSLNQAGVGANGTGGLVVKDIPLGLHTVTIQYKAGGAACRVGSLDIITPIHYPKHNGPYFLGNTLRIGSEAICDTRPIALDKDIIYNKTLGIVSAPTVTSADGTVPVKDLINTIYVPENGMYKISCNVQAYCASAGPAIYLSIYHNGSLLNTTLDQQQQVLNTDLLFHTDAPIFLTKGAHTIAAMMSISSSTLVIHTLKRWLTVTKA